MRTKFLALLLALSWLGLGAGRAGEKISVALYLAENSPPPPTAVLAPEALGERLYDVFGFKYYKLVKAGEIQLGREWEQWVVPRKDFFMRLVPLPRQPGEPRLIDYEIYKDGFIVAKGRYEPREGTPLFINGPDFNQGRFIFVLEAR